MKNLDPSALECLAALVDEGSFERAAVRLAITQSAVSQRLRALESSVGQLLVVRSRPLRLTEPGRVLLRYARQWQALRADAERELDATVRPDERLPIAVNADSLATWVLPALDPLVQDGLLLELIVDDQDFTHERLRQGAVLGCVSTVSQALRGCSLDPLGAMEYVAVASPAFVARELPRGLHRGNFAEVPFLVFDRKDDMTQLWVEQAFGVRGPRLRERFVPSSEAYVQAARMGWGVGIVPLPQVPSELARGELVLLHPQVRVHVPLYWHCWKLGDQHRPGSTLGRIGDALVAGARAVLQPLPATGSGA
ncbi:LysR family transcriptional regulator ArgP [Caldimonas thermodepolymerans]|jgi:transcriptional regulator, ArgP family|uniref:LysR family transcriptional regulator ArgP n=1 Tax=Caldimonas thermodepolymerans TaxID=215580 RepID=UPI0022359466|nr:LysR family transcriptional regulator ArgP [Caldimonas thermodepolymerans]UZG44241.1 LysR family transcriptional regulator ArgP [Caldimonas thermodepolymerans]